MLKGYYYYHPAEENASERINYILRLVGKNNWWEPEPPLPDDWIFQAAQWSQVPDPLLLFVHYRTVKNMRRIDWEGKVSWEVLIEAARDGLNGKRVYVLVVSGTELVPVPGRGLQAAIDCAKDAGFAGFSYWQEPLDGENEYLAKRVTDFVKEIANGAPISFKDFYQRMKRYGN